MALKWLFLLTLSHHIISERALVALFHSSWLAVTADPLPCAENIIIELPIICENGLSTHFEVPIQLNVAGDTPTELPSSLLIQLITLNPTFALFIPQTQNIGEHFRQFLIQLWSQVDFLLYIRFNWVVSVMKWFGIQETVGVNVLSLMLPFVQWTEGSLQSAVFSLHRHTHTYSISVLLILKLETLSNEINFPSDQNSSCERAESGYKIIGQTFRITWNIFSETQNRIGNGIDGGGRRVTSRTVSQIRLT